LRRVLAPKRCYPIDWRPIQFSTVFRRVVSPRIAARAGSEMLLPD